MLGPRTRRTSLCRQGSSSFTAVVLAMAAPRVSAVASLAANTTVTRAFAPDADQLHGQGLGRLREPGVLVDDHYEGGVPWVGLPGIAHAQLGQQMGPGLGYRYGVGERVDDAGGW